MTVKNRFSTVRWVISAQIFVVLVVSSLAYFLWGNESVKWVLCGGGVAIVPNAYFALKIYLSRHLIAADILSAFYRGETVKLLLTASLFVLVLQLPAVDFKFVLVGYIATIFVFWFALFYWCD